MSIFSEIKQRTDMASVAVHYGFTPNRSGYICCPFHAEKTPSMKLYDKSYHCFGCGEHGDAVSFVSKLYDLSAIEAARKINEELGLGIIRADNIRPYKKRDGAIRRGDPCCLPCTPNISQVMSYYKEWERYAWRILNAYSRLLKQWQRNFAPLSQSGEPYPLWKRAVTELPLIENYISILISGTDEERKRFYITKRREVALIEAEYNKYVTD